MDDGSVVLIAIVVPMPPLGFRLQILYQSASQPYIHDLQPLADAKHGEPFFHGKIKGLKLQDV